MTKVLQPIDVCINKPFKDFVREKYENRLHNKYTSTHTGKIRRASEATIELLPRSMEATVAGYISTAWKKIPSDLIIPSFKKMLY